ncbi:MAG: type II toxin-antitoxin system HicB family antitoxin [Parcubacteria group bacterium]|nr:type II toxin-antitoxin system HicB family antitoxin [Candidatus Liptonbacteria bacterium]MBI3020177.1 type II toxin-antitoxin system HicB family antitoxin [Parcubacteria group bacterium]MBI3075188.1 type II toxin-antitoxin system HicB family antitoxin [Parcubacteria group bacterium]
MQKEETNIVFYNKQLPILVEKEDDGLYTVECPLFEGCYTQGKTIDEALQNIREVLALILEEEDAQETLREYHPENIGFQAITI